MNIVLEKLGKVKNVGDLEKIDSLEIILSVLNNEIKPMSVTAQSYEELFSIIQILKKKLNIFNSDVYFKNENVKIIYSLLYARTDVRNENIGYSEKLLEDEKKAKKWYKNIMKKIHPDANLECKDEAKKAMEEFETIYMRIQKCFVKGEE